jgi:hypothetical protein
MSKNVIIFNFNFLKKIKNYVCFLHPMNILKGLQLFFNVSLIGLNAWEDE